jgi:hypothetical protein
MYDEIIVRDKIEYGIIHGIGKLFYIKVGNGGDVYGSEDRYFRISRQIHDGYGCSVLVASNPVEMSLKEGMALDMDFARECFPDAVEIRAMGHSNGGQMLASCAYLYPEIKRVLAVNAPLIINLHKTKAGIKNFAGEKMHMVYGSKDPCFMYTPVLNACVCEKFSYSIVENANHDFKDMAEEFVALPKQFLF